jgi:hypothetical protein
MHSPPASSNNSARNKSLQMFSALAFALLTVTLWLLMRGYQGLTGDGQIYAFQALARIHPQLATDLYLQNTTQDQYTIFSPLYAWCIRLLDLENAARLLTLLFTVWLLAAAWNLGRAFTGPKRAWLAVAFLLIVTGDYGGSGVFRLSESFLTARLPAEAIVVTALACHVRGMKRLGLTLATAALFVHPLIALPGLLLLSCLWLPNRAAIVGVIGGILVTVGIALAARDLPSASPVLPLMDAAWLDVVKERSQFLFLQLWSAHDWDVNARPFIYLVFTVSAVPDERIRKLATAAALVGAAGLAVALTGSVVGPVAILVQGQGWRWIWIAVFVSVLLLPITALQAWRDEKCGPLCTLLLIAGWTLSPVDGTACASLALILWLSRTHLDERVAPYMRYAAAAFGITIVAWVLNKSWVIVSSQLSPSVRGLWGASQLRDIFGLRIPAAIFAALLWWTICAGRTIWVPAVLSAALAGLSIYVLPAAFGRFRTLTSAADIEEFADWTRAIPPTSTVLVAPARDVGGFVWFTLHRPNYLTVDQSSGVVFSRATALEVQRRSQVLLPLMDPNWKILSGLRAASAAGKHTVQAASRPLTAQSLALVCADPVLGFVVSPDNIGVDLRRHGGSGKWKDWNLYDCRQVRSAKPAT